LYKVRVFVLVSVFAALLTAGCTDRSAQPDHQTEWHAVLQQKKAAAAPDATSDQKQAYADSVRAFVQKHPEHSRAREVWQRMQIEFANDLASIGRYQDAIRFYRVVLAHDSTNDAARRGLAMALERLAVTREKLLALEKGMSHREVASILGKPIPGWTARKERPNAEVEAWYYKMRDGGLAAVYFRNGKVFAAEETSNAPLGRLGS